MPAAHRLRSTASHLGSALLPPGRDFAFTILDDTDDSTVANTAPVYALLRELGLWSTKTVWPVDCPEGSAKFFAGHTMARPEYRKWAQDLQRQGFEITWHCATMESSSRARTIQGLEDFRRDFGDYPRIHVNHANNLENLYWGPSRYRSELLRLAHRLTVRPSLPYSGEIEGSPHFWGDLHLKHFRYTRAFAFKEINTLRADPGLVYRLARTPWVNAWFSTSDAPDAAAFKRLVTRQAVDRLRAERGVCIVSTHLGKRFANAGVVDPEVEEMLRYVASQSGWFVPVSRLLDAAVAAHGGVVPLRGPWAQTRLELRHVSDRLR